MMEMKEFQAKLGQLMESAKLADNNLTNTKILDTFGANQLSPQQLQSLYEYLRIQGIRIEGADLKKMDIGKHIEEAVKAEISENTLDEKEHPAVMDMENQECLKEYEEHLENFCPEKTGEREQLLEQAAADSGSVQERLAEVYLADIIEMAKKLYREDFYIGDLIQEGSMVLLTVSFADMPQTDRDEWLKEQIYTGIESWIKEQTEQKYRDESLVEKVRKLEAAIKELSDDEEPKFSIEELSAYLDMSEEEIRGILSLTSEGSQEEQE
ncbi:MAG: hypothetical protein EOM40_04035 [Clostridia bacterium]|nr:hypothetical protein [Clostridia bacterium]